jgi:hypothetical protein
MYTINYGNIIYALSPTVLLPRYLVFYIPFLVPPPVCHVDINMIPQSRGIFRCYPDAWLVLPCMYHNISGACTLSAYVDQ